MGAIVAFPDLESLSVREERARILGNHLKGSSALLVEITESAESREF